MQIAAWRKIEDYRASDLIEGDAGLRKIDDHRKFETLERLELPDLQRPTVANQP